MKLTLDFETTKGRETREVAVTQAVIGGWTGRDRAALQHHIDELAEIGVLAPPQTPMFYAFSRSRLTTADAIEVIGDGSSGEVEYVMLQTGGQLWVSVGSDHTDRVFESAGITLAKQLCDKPVGRVWWSMQELADHWEKLELRSYIPHGDGRVLYQEGGVAGLLAPDELIAKYAEIGGQMVEGTLMFGGTCAAIGSVRFAPRFEMELHDPVLNRTLRHGYAVETLEIRG